MMNKRIFVCSLLMTLFLLVRISFADIYLNLGLNVTDNIYKGSSQDVKVNCSFVNTTGNITENATKSFSGKILDSKGNVIKTLETEVGKDSRTYVFPSFLENGIYNISVTCSGSIGNASYVNSTSSLVRVWELGLNILEVSPQIIYPDSDIVVYANLTEMAEVKKTVTANDMATDKWKVYVDSEDFTGPTVYNYDSMKWKIPVSKALDSGGYELKLETAYKGKTVSTTRWIEVVPIMDVSITSVGDTIISGENFTISLDVTYRGNSTPLKDTKLSVSIDGKAVPVQETKINSVIVQAPENPPGTYDLKVSVEYRGASASDSDKIDYYIPFRGKILGAKGISVSGKLILSKSGYSKTVVVQNGVYSSFIPSGTYSVELADFPGMKSAIFSGVTIDKEEDIINYDHLVDVGLPEFKTAGGVALEFALPFSEVSLEVKYDSSAILSEKDLQVYKCSNWNFAARSCAGNWTNVSSDIDMVRDMVKIKPSAPLVFVVAERAGLSISAKLEKTEYYLGENVVATGVVRDERDNPVKEARVTYELANRSGEMLTDQQGIFSTHISAPQDAGTFKLLIRAERGQFEAASTTLEFSTVAKKELSLIFGMEQAVEAGKNSTIKVTVFNTGQATLNNFKVDIKGLSEEWFNYYPKKWDKLGPGEEKEITIQLFPPTSSENQNYQMTVDVESDEVKKTDSFVLILHGRVPEKMGIEGEGGIKLPAFPNLTGLMVAAPTSILDALSIFALVGFVVFLAKRMLKRGKKNREDIASLIRNLRQEFNEAAKSGRMFKCGKCGMEFDSRRTLESHMKDHGRKKLRKKHRR